MPSLSDYADALTGAGARDAARDAADIQAKAVQAGIDEVRAGKAESLGYLSPYAESGKGGLNQYVDYLGGRQVQDTPYGRQLMERQLETARRETQGLGMGGGARLKRLMNEAAFTTNSLRQHEMQNSLALGQMGQNAATNQANIATGAAGGIADALGSKGAAQAAGVIGAQNGINQGLGNMIQLGTAVAGGMTGNPVMAAGGAQGLGSGTASGSAESNPSGWDYQSIFNKPNTGNFSLR